MIGGNRTFAACTAAVAVALAASLWSWGVPLTNDGAVHVFVAYVLNHIDDPRFAPHYEATAPLTSRGFHEVQRLLEPVFGWRTAWRMNVVLVAELWAFGFLAFVSALDARRRWLGLLGFALPLNGLFYLGLLPFTYATALGWWVLAFWLSRARHPERPAARPSLAAHAALALSLYVVARIHVGPAALVGLLLVALALVDGAHDRESRSGRALRLGLLALAGAPALAIALLTSGETGVGGEPGEENLLARLWSVFAMVPAGPVWRGAFAASLALAGLAAAIRRARRISAIPGATDSPASSGAPHPSAAMDATRDARSGVLALAGLAGLLVAWTLPRDLSGWQFAGVRSAPLALGLLCAVLPLDDRARPLRLLTALGAVAFLIGTLAWSFSLHARMREANAPALALLDTPLAAPSPDGGDHDWTMVTLASPEGTWPLPAYVPLFQLHQLFALENGGRVTYGHDSIRSAHHIRARWVQLVTPQRIPALDDPAVVAPALRRELSYAAQHGLLVLAGNDAHQKLALDAGFVELKRSGPSPLAEQSVLIARFEGCRGVLRVEDAHTAITVDVGWFPRRSPSVTVGHVPNGALNPANDAGSPNGVAIYPLPPLGCGEVWAAATAGGVCAGQGPMAPLRATFTRGGDNVLVCRAEPLPASPVLPAR